MEELSQAPDADFFDIDRGLVKVSYELGEQLIVNLINITDGYGIKETDQFI